MRLFVGDDWAEDHHDVEVMDAAGRRLAKARVPEGVTGMARLHAMIGQAVGDAADQDEDVEVLVGIETDRGPWVRALVAGGISGLRGQPVAGSTVRATAQCVGREERRR